MLQWLHNYKLYFILEIFVRNVNNIMYFLPICFLFFSRALYCILRGVLLHIIIQVGSDNEGTPPLLLLFYACSNIDIYTKSTLKLSTMYFQ